MKRYCGRDFCDKELAHIRQLIADNPNAHRAELSRQVCRMLAWYKADGGLKDMSCRVAMLRMHEDKIICLPPPRRAKAPVRKRCPTSTTDPQLPIQKPVHQLGELQLCLVKPANSRLWNEYIERYHYLGFSPLPGAQLRYFVTLNGQVTCLARIWRCSLAGGAT